MVTARTLFDKVWSQHEIVSVGDRSLLLVDLNYVHEGSIHAFAALAEDRHPVRRPDRTVAVADHYVPTVGRPEIPDPSVRTMVDGLATNARAHGIVHIGMDDPRQGIVHVIGPELGLSLPGMFIVCADSHVSTHGALGALTWAIGTSDLKHVLATQAIWLRKPRSMRVVIDGRLGIGVTAKDVILAIIVQMGANGAAGHVIEYAGAAVRDLSIEGRLTLCNMSIEAGARAGLISPDDKTFAYIEGRSFAPVGAAWDAAVQNWRSLRTDPDAVFDREIAVSADDIGPMVTWGTSPEDAAPINGVVPDPADIADPERRALKTQALRYMDLQPGQPMTDIRIDRVFIGSCTNARIEDLRTAARVLKHGKAVVPAFVVPGSRHVRVEAEAEGLDRVFREAGFEWRDAGCSMCVGVNGDLLAPGERCAATSNRNFEGRQGPGSRTHLMSPIMAAAAALTGRLTDVRPFLEA